ncbi:MAG: hypothetical protein ABIA63_06150 [bacterium]
MNKTNAEKLENPIKINASHNGDFISILSVKYLHVKTENNGDLYLTEYGIPLIENLRPVNWYKKDWFEQNREKLKGTSTVYRVKTKEINGRSADIVVKWCRVGEEVPADTRTMDEFTNVEFNTPYEEFSLVFEMRGRKRKKLIRTHKPLAIFKPPEILKLWQTGRSKSKIAQKKAKFMDVELDIFRQYILIYEWIKGYSADEVYEHYVENRTDSALHMADITRRAIADMEKAGFRVLDIKPAHIILRLNGEREVVKDRKGKTPYALVDFELLERTPKYEKKVKALKRGAYIKRQEGKVFSVNYNNFPPHLSHINIFGLDYIYGVTESTRGILWVAGNDPLLFDYFLPERWRHTPRRKLSQNWEIYSAVTKDNIHVVWKVSHVGETPEDTKEAEYGYNSPFQEFAFARELDHLGIRTIFPRAIYMTGITSKELLVDDKRRFDSHQNILMKDGTPILMANHNYITIWGYWYGPVENKNAAKTRREHGINLLEAYNNGFISKEIFLELIERKRARLAKAGFEDLRMKGDHMIISLTADGSFKTGADGLPEIRICNFDLMKRLDSL